MTKVLSKLVSLKTLGPKKPGQVNMAKERKSAPELAKLLREFSPELNDARVSIIADRGPHNWRVQPDRCSESASVVSKELERAWAHLVYEYELK
jgi:hypothetical protein